MPTAPDITAIDHDDYHASHVGRTTDGHQFFLTTPFIPPFDTQTLSRVFVALFLFEKDGTLVEARIDDLGSQKDRNDACAQHVFAQRLRELGEVDYGRIIVQPFQIQRFDTVFGLVAHAPRQKDGDWWVTLEPGNSMAFHETWAHV